MRGKYAKWNYFNGLHFVQYCTYVFPSDIEFIDMLEAVISGLIQYRSDIFELPLKTQV
jgi:hypothetical protein